MFLSNARDSRPLDLYEVGSYQKPAQKISCLCTFKKGDTRALSTEDDIKRGLYKIYSLREIIFYYNILHHAVGEEVFKGTAS